MTYKSQAVNVVINADVTEPLTRESIVQWLSW
jgi:hypothetical protein